MTADPDTLPADAPPLDTAYLDDMRGWVGDDTLAILLAEAPRSIDDETGAIRAAWAQGDLHAVREAGHRLKGAASSIACRRLALLGHGIQTVAGLDDPALLERIAPESAAAFQAIGRYRAGLAGG